MPICRYCNKIFPSDGPHIKNTVCPKCLKTCRKKTKIKIKKTKFKIKYPITIREK